MQTTPGSTMDEIIAGYTGEDKYEKTMNEIGDFSDFVSKVLQYVLEFVNFIKGLLG